MPVRNVTLYKDQVLAAYTHLNGTQFDQMFRNYTVAAGLSFIEEADSTVYTKSKFSSIFLSFALFYF